MFSKILVTGCGGDIGLGLGRIIRMSSLSESVIGCDVHINHPGDSVFDKCCLISKADSPFYFEELIYLCKKNAVDLIIAASEPELRCFLYKGIEESIGQIPIIMANKKSLEVGFDKLKTVEFLKSESLSYPWTKIVRQGPPEELPCIIKSRTGSGSKSVHLLEEEELIDYFIRKYPDNIWQEYLEPDDQEYTCGLYRSQSKDIRTIIFKRVLAGGRTGYGEVVENSDINNLLIHIAEGLDLKGSINVQLRLTWRGPVVFEINPRFSSTVVFRHLLGFTDLIWSIYEKAGLPLPDYTSSKTGIRFYRGDREIIFNN